MQQAAVKTASPITNPMGECVIAVSRADLPLACPRPGDSLWNMHPRVYLPIADEPDGEVVCPYCGAHYRFSD
jgi:uncharacterized Zn-finger protein